MQETRPLVLVTNDDGVDSDGIEALAAAAGAFGEVWVVAPSSEQSGVGHGITLHRPLKVEQCSERTYCVNGTPSDCVWLAIRSLLPRKPRLVLSGINRGANLGEDATYSGTVAGAMEGALRGVPSIAFSLVGRDVFDFSGTKDWVCKVIEGMEALQDEGDLLLSVNLPPFGNGWIRGIQVTRMARGLCRVDGHVIATTDPEGNKIYSFAKKDILSDLEPGTDVYAVMSGYVSVTPLVLDWTRYSISGALEKAYALKAQNPKESQMPREVL